MDGAPSSATGLATAVGLAGTAWCCALFARSRDAEPNCKRGTNHSSIDAADAGALGEDWRSEAGQEALRAAEFARIGDAVYLDHAGATLHSERQLSDVVAQLNGNLYGNPHSQNESSTRASDGLRRAREATLRHFNTSAQQYDIIFTANATAALKLVGESFPWSDSSELAYTVQNHNSVLGIREYAAEHGARFSAVDYGALLAQLTEAQSGLRKPRPSVTASGQEPTHSLFAFPGECNFSGQKLDLQLIDLFQSGRAGRASSTGEWCVLLDAAKLAATSRVDLSKHPVDFMCISFYKMFGYPTGLGALLVRRCPMRPACWRLQSPALPTARCLRIPRAPWSLHRLRARSRACRLCGSPTTPHNRPERPDWRIATAAGLSHTEAKWLSLWAVGSRQASCGAWEGTATPTGPWTPLFRRGARSRRRCACLPAPCCGQICPPSSHPHLCNTPQTAPVCPPAHPVPLGCVGAAEAG